MDMAFASAESTRGSKIIRWRYQPWFLVGPKFGFRQALVLYSYFWLRWSLGMETNGYLKPCFEKCVRTGIESHYVCIIDETRSTSEMAQDSPSDKQSLHTQVRDLQSNRMLSIIFPCKIPNCLPGFSGTYADCWSQVPFIIDPLQMPV